MENNWLLPITLLPGIALLVLSTVTISVSLTRDISDLIERGGHEKVSAARIAQLGLINKALILLYLSIALITLSVIAGAYRERFELGRFTMPLVVSGIALLFLAMILLIVYAFRSVYIRKAQLKNELKKKKAQ